MRYRTIQALVALLLVTFGWIAGTAQTPAPEFTLAIKTASGRTTVTFVRGCVLQGGRDEGNPNNTPTSKYSFKCQGASSQRSLPQ